MLVEDEPELLRATASGRSRVEKEFLPDGFERFPSKRTGEVGNDARIRRRVSARKGILPAWIRTRWGKITALVIVLTAMAAAAAVVLATRNFLLHDPRFRINSSDSIQTMGNSQLTRDDLLSVFGSDIGRNIFYVPLGRRRMELEQIPWVEHATVMRILPNELRVTVRERTPVAFARVGNQIKLVDAEGVLLDMPPAMMAARHYSFPVVTGINPRDPLSARAARMGLYEEFMKALNSDGQHLSANVSEVNLSDPEDVRVTIPVKSTDLLLHLGDKDFLARYRVFESHLSEWEQQYPQLAAVDLRYSGEVVLKMANDAGAQGAAGSKAGAKSAAPKKRASSNRRKATVRRHSGRTRR